MANRIVQTVLQWVTDTASLAKLQNANRTVGDSVAQVSRRGVTSNQELAASFNTVARSAEKAAASATIASRAASSGALASARSVAGAAGGVLATVGGGQAGSAVASILGLTATLGPLGLAAGVVTVGAGLLTNELERQAVAFKDYAAGIKSQADLVASGATTADVEKQVTNLHTAEQFVAQRIATLNQYEAKVLEIDEVFRDDPEKWGAALEAVFQEVSGVTGTTITDLHGLQGSIDALTTESNSYNVAILNLNRLMQSGALSANDAAAALKYLTDAQEENAKRLKEAEEIRGKALQNQNAQQIALINDEVNARQKLFEIEQEIKQTLSERSAAILAIQQERDAQIAEITEEGGERRAEIVADSEARIARIHRDSGQTIQNAIATRDALAAHLEKQRLATAVTDEKDAGAKALAAQTVAEKKSLDQSVKNYDKQIAAQVSSGDKALTALQATKRQEEFLVYNSQQAQLNAVAVGTMSVESQTIKHWNTMADIAYTGGYNAAAQFQNGIQAALGGRVGGFPTPQTLSSTYPGGPSQKAVLDKHFDQRFSQTIKASKGGREGF